MTVYFVIQIFLPITIIIYPMVPAVSATHFNLEQPVAQYIARRMGPILFGVVQCYNCSVEGHGAIDQLRNSLGTVCVLHFE